MASGLLSLKWNHHRSTFLHVLANIRQKESYCDVTLACAGKFYSAHKLVLSTCSEYFEEMFERTQCKHPVIVLKDIGADELEALLSYMYDGEVNVLQENLSSLIKAAECLKIKGLAVADSDPSEHSSKSTKDKSSSSSSSNSNGKDVHRSHNSNSTSNSNNHSFQSDSSSRQFRNSSGGVKRPSLSSKQDDGPSKRRRPEPSSLSSAAASPARRQSTERPSSAPRGGAADAKDGDDGGSDGADGGEDGGNSMEGTPSAVDDQPHEDGGPEDARSFAQGLSEQTGVKAEPVEIIDSDDMGGFDPQTGDGGSHDASDAEFTEEKFASGGADANDPSLWGGGANNDMFSQPSTSSFTGQDGSNSNDNNSGGGKGGGGGSSVSTTSLPHWLQSTYSSPPPNQDPSYPVDDDVATLSSRLPYSSKLGDPNVVDITQDTFDDGSAVLDGEDLVNSPPYIPAAHSRLRHSNSRKGGEGGKYVCPLCPFVASRVADLTNHFRAQHHQHNQQSAVVGKQPQQLQCPFCSYTTCRNDHLKIHIRYHTGEKPYQCPHCDYRSAQKSHVNVHVQKRHKARVVPAAVAGSPSL